MSKNEDSSSRCPVCGVDYREDGLCEHLVYWDYAESCENWPGKSDPWELYKIASEMANDIYSRFAKQQRVILKMLLKSPSKPSRLPKFINSQFTVKQLDVLKMLLKLPSDLQSTFAGEMDEEGYSPWTDLIGDMIWATPECVSSSEANNEPSGPGTASSWTNYWVRNATTCGRSLDKKLNSYIKALKLTAKAVSKLPEV